MASFLQRSSFLLLLAALPGRGADDLEHRFHHEVVPLLERYCLDCHDSEVQKGDLDLTVFESLEDVQAGFETWQTVVQQLVEEEMPPKDPLPSAEERARLATWAKESIDAIDWTQFAKPVHLTLPRLTKTEYNNTLRDLLGIDLQPGALLLDDGQGLSGFTNDRDALFVSPALAEQLFAAPEYALGAILGLRTKPVSMHFEAEKMLFTERGSQPQELAGGGIGYSLAGAGQRTLFDEINVPVDGWYRLSVRAVGIGGQSGMRLRIDDEPRADFRIAGEKPQIFATELLLRSGTHQMVWNIQLTSEQRSIEREAAEIRRQAQVKSKANQKAGGVAPPLPGNAADLVDVASRENAPRLPLPADANREAVALGKRLDAGLLGMQRRLEYLRLVTPRGDPDQLRGYYNLLPERTAAMAKVKGLLAKELGLSVKEVDQRLLDANRERIESNQTVLRESLEVVGVEYDPQFLFGNAPPRERERVGAPGVDWITIEGPIRPEGADPDRVAALFPTDAASAFRDFLPRAFRRPLRDGELDRHLALYEAAKERGESHDEALRLAYTAALVSPAFLYRDELGSAGESFSLNDHQLACRLSYFLWMTMPDEELRSLANAGRLGENEVLRGQVRRMLRDPRARAFTSAFLGQWLGFDGIGREHVPDAKRFPDFDETLAEAMKLEPVLVFEHLLREGRSLDELLDTRETFANGPLAKLYGLDDVSGSKLQPVVLPDGDRGGLLGMAAVLTASSTPNRTSPVLRGKWILENLLGRHLAEPPADAGRLDDQAGEARGKTLREELAEHRRNESCAGCHDKIDPIGFGLENFDAIGRFRENEAKKPVDASGELPGGVTFNGPAEMRELLKSRHREEFLANVTKRLAAFALGRALGREDEKFLHDLAATLEVNKGRADALVEAIVTSETFRTQGAVKN